MSIVRLDIYMIISIVEWTCVNFTVLCFYSTMWYGQTQYNNRAVMDFEHGNIMLRLPPGTYHCGIEAILLLFIVEYLINCISSTLSYGPPPLQQTSLSEQLVDVEVRSLSQGI